jgi:hypothetical protein
VSQAGAVAQREQCCYCDRTRRHGAGGRPGASTGDAVEQRQHFSSSVGLQNEPRASIGLIIRNQKTSCSAASADAGAAASSNDDSISIHPHKKVRHDEAGGSH